MDKKTQILNAFIKLDEKSVTKLITDALASDEIPPDEIVEVLENGMHEIGEMYENGIYFIADLIMSGIIFKQTMKIPQIEQSFMEPKTKSYSGVVIVGSVMEDKHDIGKNMFADIAIASGLNVIDLGVDVPKEQFAESIRDHNADIVCLSALLTAAIPNMKLTIEYLEEQNLRDKVKILIAGNPLSENVCKYLEADAFSKNISDGLNICLKWLSK